MEVLRVSDIGKKQNDEWFLHNISFVQNKAQDIAIAGETGSGKTTLLKMIAGFIQPDKGELFFEGKRILGPEEKLMPGHPGISYLSQHFELPNHYLVEEILKFENKIPEKEAEKLFTICHIDHLLQRKTQQLSGGEKQRVSLARLLVNAPKLLILDEPFSNLDMIHKNILKSVIQNIRRNLDINCIMVSHDPLDILSWANEILVLKDGTIIQKGSPTDIYRHPINEYVAGLFGKYNLLSSTLLNAIPQYASLISGGERLFTRPEDFSLTENVEGAFCGRVKDILFLGNGYEVNILVSEQLITIRTDRADLIRDQVVYFLLKEKD